MAALELKQQQQAPPQSPPPKSPAAAAVEAPPSKVGVADVGLGLAPEGPTTMEAVAEELNSLKLDGDGSVGAVKDGLSEEDEGNMDEKKARLSFYPQRPNKPDCSFYLKTGKCAYGKNCKFNHPVTRKKNQVQSKDSSASDQVSFTGSDTEKRGGESETLEIVEQPQCKYHLMPGGCKYGNACRYGHTPEKIESGQVELNFLGLPVRPGERECPFYMRNGSCKFASNCRFHHPDPNPTASNGSYPQAGYTIGDNSHPPTLGASQPPMAQWSLPRSSNESMPYVGVAPPYMPHVLGPPSAVPVNSGWNNYQHLANPSFIPGQRVYDPPVMTTNGATRSAPSYQYEQLKQSSDFPQRPGQPNCSYYMKNGECKFRSACKFHHPQNWHPENSACRLSPLGLPLRPGQSICTHYSRFGICKFGPSCMYDHPVNHVPSQAMTQ